MLANAFKLDAHTAVQAQSALQWFFYVFLAKI